MRPHRQRLSRAAKPALQAPVQRPRVPAAGMLAAEWLAAAGTVLSGAELPAEESESFWSSHGLFAVVIAALILAVGGTLAGWRWHTLSLERQEQARLEEERAREEAERLVREQEEAATKAAAVAAAARALLVNPDLNGEYHLLPETVQLQSPNLSVGVQGKQRVIEGWKTGNDEVTWELQIPKADLFQIHLSYSTAETGAAGRVYVRVGEEEKSVDLIGTGDPTTFRSDRLFLAIKKRGKRTLRLRIEPPTKPLTLHLQSVKLVPYGLGKK